MNGFDSNPNQSVDTTPGLGAVPSSDPYAGHATGAPYAAPGERVGGAIPPPPSGLPNPALATFLGFIPGVGAMYNGQFAKGLAQIVIFAVLVSLADHVNNIFGLLVTGWIFYMVFDSYQTARARRDGLQVPDPFGLNNIGERMGIGNGPNWSDFTARPMPGQVPPAPRSADPAAAPYPGNAVPPVSPYPPPPYAPFTPPAEAAYAETGYAPPAHPGYAPPAYSAATPPFVATAFDPAAYPPPLPPLTAAGGLPTGALWLIGLGLFALAGTLSHRFSWSNRFLDGAIVMAVGITILITSILRAQRVYPAGTAAATWYILRSTRAGLILVAIGVSLTLNHLGNLTWADLWPWLLILLGGFLLLERAAHNRMMAAGPVSSMASVEPTGEPAPHATTSSFVPPAATRSEEGRES